MNLIIRQILVPICFTIFGLLNRWNAILWKWSINDNNPLLKQSMQKLIIFWLTILLEIPVLCLNVPIKIYRKLKNLGSWLKQRMSSSSIKCWTIVSFAFLKLNVCFLYFSHKRINIRFKDYHIWPKLYAEKNTFVIIRYKFNFQFLNK